jgi:hypothetical protein
MKVWIVVIVTGVSLGLLLTHFVVAPLLRWADRKIDQVYERRER